MGFLGSQNMQKDLLPEEVESLSSIAMGFTDLANGNPELAYRVLVDILAGMNECVPPSIPSSCHFLSNHSVASQ